MKMTTSKGTLMRTRTLHALMIMIAAWLCSSASHAQWASIYGEEPYNLGYSDLRELSTLLELDAPTHELLAALHLELMQAEATLRQEARDELQKRTDAGEEIGWSEGVQISFNLTNDFEKAGDRFFEDVKLIVHPEQAPLIEHMRRRTRMGRWLEGIGSEVSELGAMPLKLLADRDIVSDDRLRELILTLSDQEARVSDQFQRTYEAVLEMQSIGQRIGFDFDEAGPEIIAETAKIFKKAIEEAKRLRTMNEELASTVMEQLDQEQRRTFEQIWWEINYEEVHDEWIPERAVRTLLGDEKAPAELKQRVEEIRAVFDDRLRTARRMARVAKYRTDLELDFSMLLNGGEPDTKVYDDALKRLSGIAESYASALKGVMTKEQRLQYGLEIPDDAR